MDIIPYGNVMLVQEVKVDNSQSEGGVIFTKETQEEDNRRQSYSQGIVISVDTFLEGQREIKPKTGILFNTVLAKPVGNDRYIVKVTDVYATLKEKKKKAK